MTVIKNKMKKKKGFKTRVCLSLLLYTAVLPSSLCSTLFALYICFVHFVIMFTQIKQNTIIIEKEKKKMRALTIQSMGWG